MAPHWAPEAGLGRRRAICLPLLGVATAALVETTFLGSRLAPPRAAPRQLVLGAQGQSAPKTSNVFQATLGCVVPLCCLAAAQLRSRSVASRPARHVRHFFGGSKKEVKENDEQHTEEALSERAKANCEALRTEIEEINAVIEDKQAARDRLQMEMDNYRTRTRQELAAARGRAAVPLIKEMMLVADEFVLAQQNLKAETEGEKAVVSRFQNVFSKMLDSWRKLGVEKLEAVGQEFNPELHEAVTMLPSEQYKADIVCAELRGGWVLKTSGSEQPQVLRPALVCVSAGPGP